MGLICLESTLIERFGIPTCLRRDSQMLGLIGSWLRRAVDHGEPATVQRGRLCFLSLPLVASRVEGFAPLAPIVIFFRILAPTTADGGQRSNHFLFRGVTNFATGLTHVSPPSECPTGLIVSLFRYSPYCTIAFFNCS